MESQEQPVTLHNTGSDPFDFEFIPKLGDRSCCAPWLEIEPKAGVVEPGKIVIINMRVWIDNDSLQTIDRDRKLDVSMVKGYKVSNKIKLIMRFELASISKGEWKFSLLPYSP